MAWGREVSPADPRRHDRRAAGLRRRGLHRHRAAVRRRSRCPVTVLHGTDDQVRGLAYGERLAELTGGSLIRVEGAGHGPPAARPGAGQPRDPRVRRALRARRRDAGARTWAPGRTPAAAGALPVLADRPRATPAATSRWPTSCARCTPTSRSTGSPRTRSPGCSPPHGERVHPASRAPGQRVRARRARVGRARPARVPGASAGWTRSWSTTSWSSTSVDRGRALRPRHRRRGLGRRLLPAREPGAQAVAVRLVHRLRRLAADARRRRGGGRADRRPQRRDDRAPGALPRGCATARSSSATPTTSCPTRFGPGLPGDPRVDRAELRLRRLRHRLRPRGATTSPSCARGSATAPTSTSAWSPSGGSGVGLPLLRRVLDAVPLARRQVPGAAVRGRRRARASIPRSLPRGARAPRCTATCPTSPRTWPRATSPSSQGGLTTCMELTALRKPFLYVPLRHHFEQNFHVRRRLDRYRAGHLPGLRGSPPTPTPSPRPSSAELDRDVGLPPGRDRRRRAGRRAARRPALTPARRPEVRRAGRRAARGR